MANKMRNKAQVLNDFHIACNSNNPITLSKFLSENEEVIQYIDFESFFAQSRKLKVNMLAPLLTSKKLTDQLLKETTVGDIKTTNMAQAMDRLHHEGQSLINRWTKKDLVHDWLFNLFCAAINSNNTKLIQQLLQNDIVNAQLLLNDAKLIKAIQIKFPGQTLINVEIVRKALTRSTLEHMKALVAYNRLDLIDVTLRSVQSIYFAGLPPEVISHLFQNEKYYDMLLNKNINYSLWSYLDRVNADKSLITNLLHYAIITKNEDALEHLRTYPKLAKILVEDDDLLNIYKTNFPNNYLRLALDRNMDNAILEKLFNIAIKDKNEQVIVDAISCSASIFSLRAKSEWLVENYMKSSVFKSSLQERQNKIYPALFIMEKEEVSKLLFSDIAAPEAAEDPKPTTAAKPSKAVYNLDGYNISLQENALCPLQKGKKVELSPDVPIGYNIVLPEGEVKGVNVRIYGGGIPSPGIPLTALENELLKKGVACITLNLVDLLELDTQFNMTPELLEKLHESIHHFYEIISTFPESLDPSLVALKGKPISLSGESFGGFMTAKHAELYPYSFNRYISFDGTLLIENVSKTDRAFTQGRHYKYLKAPDLSVIESDLLLLQNYDDNNVNLNMMLEFYANASKLHRTNVRMLITDKGNPLPQQMVNKGHFHPQGENLERVSDAMFQFITQGPSTLPSVSDWRGERYTLYGNRFNKSATVEDKFISEAFRIHKLFSHAGMKEPTVDDYFHIYAMVHYINTDKRSLGKYLRSLQKDKQITPADVSAALREILKNYSEFTHEKYHMPLLTNEQISQLANDPAIHEEFNVAIYAYDADFDIGDYFAFHLFMANPDLIKRYADELKKQPAVQADFVNAKGMLDTKIQSEKAAVRRVWQQVGKQVAVSATKERSKPLISGPATEADRVTTRNLPVPKRDDKRKNKP